MNDTTPASTAAARAEEGLLDELLAMNEPRDAYKWLCAALDWGHDDAEDSIAELLETSDLRYDDGRFETAAAHWELAVAYLEGAEGLPCDLSLAAAHLERAFEHHRSLDAINAGAGETYSSEPLLNRLPDVALGVLRDGLTGNRFNRVQRSLERLRRLDQIDSVPTVIVCDMQRTLRRQIVELCPLPTPDTVGGDEPLADEIELLEQTLRSTEAALRELKAERERRRRP